MNPEPVIPLAYEVLGWTLVTVTALFSIWAMVAIVRSTTTPCGRRSAGARVPAGDAEPRVEHPAEPAGQHEGPGSSCVIEERRGLRCGGTGGI